MYDVVIIGAGPAGLTAGIYTARGGLKTAIVELAMPGGQAASTENIENYPGFPDGINGYELMNSFHKQALTFGAEFVFEEVNKLELKGIVKKVHTHSKVLETRSIIICTGSKPRLLGVPGESAFHGRGVSYCATCDGAFFKGKKVIVVGGGNGAIEEGAYLTKFAKEVVIVHRRADFRASYIAIKRAKDNPKIRFELNSVIEEIIGAEHVERVRMRELLSGKTRDISADGVFIYAGTDPNVQFIDEDIKRDERGYILTNRLLQTNINGVYAAGDIRDTPLRQVATAVGDGALVAVEIEKYLSGNSN